MPIKRTFISVWESQPSVTVIVAVLVSTLVSVDVLVAVLVSVEAVVVVPPPPPQEVRRKIEMIRKNLIDCFANLIKELPQK